jgi:hypothetical protein
MTATFEKIVRPNQLGDISPPRSPLAGGAAGDTAAQTVTLKWGDSGSAKLMFGSTTLDETFYAVKKMRERPKT